LGESETAGLVMNVVPKTGGNDVHGAAFFSGTGADLQADNGSGVPPLNNVYDLNISVGGPILKDRVWYFANGRTQAATRYIQASSTTRTPATRRSGRTRRFPINRSLPIANGKTSAAASRGR
jgi:outer membrane receptor for ferrienterochelin and colicin